MDSVYRRYDDDYDTSTGDDGDRPYRERYEHFRRDLERRDREALSDPLLLNRWPRERKFFADRVDQASAEWERYGDRNEQGYGTGEPDTRGGVTAETDSAAASEDRGTGAISSQMFNDYKKYRQRYAESKNELERGDHLAQLDYTRTQRWPIERKILSDRVQRAFEEWETLGHKSDVEAELVSRRHPTRDGEQGHDGAQGDDTDFGFDE